MNEFEKNLDQAESLRSKMIDDYKELHGDFPPRGEVHKKKQNKKKLKMQYPLISILAVFFIFVLIVLPIYLYFSMGSNQSVNSQNSSGIETVFITKGEQSGEEQDSEALEESSVTSGEEGGTKNGNETTSANENDNDFLEQNNQENINRSVEEVTNETESAPPNESEYRKVITHKVAAGETLFNIAIKYYNNRSGEEIIRQYNEIEGNNIYKGQILKIPLD